MIRLAFCALTLALWATPAHPQETQTDPGPFTPAPRVPPDGQPQSQSPASQKPAPVERRASRPTTSPDEPVDGPLDHHASAAQQAPAAGSVGTIRVESRLVNVTLNVVDENGTPAGGFERSDFRIFENGKPQPIAVFERDASSPLSIVLAVDASETVLTSERIEKQAAKHFIRAILRPQDELALVDFADKVHEIVPFTNQPRQVEDGLGEIRRGDETALFDAVSFASDRLAHTAAVAGRRRVLVVISDGGDDARHTDYSDAIEAAQRADAMIFSIIIVPVAADAGRNTGGEHTMIQMSQDTGGKYYYVNDPADLEPAFRHISDDLRTQYLLGYYAPLHSGEADEPNGFRRIQVKFADPAEAAKFTLRYRTGYYADSK